MTGNAGLLAIGDVARQTGLAVTAIRYYDEIGLINTVSRVGGKRRFDPETIGRVNFIKRAKDAGLSLEEIQTILEEQRSSWHALIEAKLTELSKRRASLDTMIGLLTEYRDCGCLTVASCPGALPS